MRIAACAIAAAALVFMAAPLFAQSEHDSMAGHDMKKMEGARHGTKIREVTVKSFKLEYYLMDMKEMAASQAHMGHELGMNTMKPQHLMIYVTAADGKGVVDAKVGLVVDAKKKAEQNLTAIFMDGSYGADVDLGPTGSSKVAVKVVVGGRTLADKFVYPLPKSK